MIEGQAVSAIKSENARVMQGRGVMERIANSAVANYDKLPMLEVVADKFVRDLAETLMHMMPANVSIELDGVRSGRFEEVFTSRDRPLVIGVMTADAWENACLAVADQPLMIGLIEVMLGGAAPSPGALAERRLTAIEQKLAQRLVGVIAEHLKEAFAPLTDVTFSVDRLEMNPQFAAIARRTSATVSLEMTLSVDGICGGLAIAFPYAALEPVRPLLQQMFMGEKFGHDVQWENHFSECLLDTELELEAILNERAYPISEIASWRPGDVIDLASGPEAPVRVVCAGREVFNGAMGQKKGRIAVQVEGSIFEDPAFEPVGRPAGGV